MVGLVVDAAGSELTPGGVEAAIGSQASCASLAAPVSLGIGSEVNTLLIGIAFAPLSASNIDERGGKIRSRCTLYAPCLARVLRMRGLKS